jgi:hypothetical protein
MRNDGLRAKIALGQAVPDAPWATESRRRWGLLRWEPVKPGQHPNSLPRLINVAESGVLAVPQS